MVTYVNYEDKYHDGVVDMILRNFTDMQGMNREVIDRWINPVFTCEFERPHPVDMPFQRGIVMLADDKIVGFTGVTYSYMEQKGRLYSLLRPTTAAVDKPWRSYDAALDTGEGAAECTHPDGKINAFERIFYWFIHSADVVTADTPAPSPLRHLLDFSHFRYFDDKNFKFFFRPCLKHELNCRFIKDPSEIEDTELRVIFADHLPFKMKCLAATGKDGETTYVLYKRNDKPMPLGLHLRFTTIHEVKNRDFFGRHANEIIWAIEKKEFAFLESDSRFFGDWGITYRGRYKVYPTHRLYYSNVEEFDAKWLSGLYCELSILDRYH